MKIETLTVRLDNYRRKEDEIKANDFMATVKVEKTATQFVPGNPDYWSILVFYTDKKADSGKKVQRPRVTEHELTEVEREILSAFKLWRKDKAGEKFVPEFMILHNAALLAAAKYKPATVSDLETVPGFNKTKIQEHGQDITAIVRAFL